ncbi:Polycystic kidney disease protein 1-like 2 [Portunus trituberculatus]|uniref:Polycystic kidney disease protein 1-like 2 n=1 Tax=Portunus trituberculatus TaxID=210409 RepID=A0A5B7CLV1_PORTR|nr:Polycystic kidney disease protein 1-like 2 [Portunus trituberculatus]
MKKTTEMPVPEQIQELVKKKTPVFGMTVHRMNKTGRHEVSLTLKWGEGTHTVLKDEVWVYIPLTAQHASLSLPNTTLTPPGHSQEEERTLNTSHIHTGDVGLALSLTSDGELPTLITGTITWGQGQGSKEVDFSQQTAPGSSGNVTRTFLHSYLEAGVFQVEVVIGNAISSITSIEQVKVMEKLVLTDIIIQYLREEDRPPQNTSSSSTSSSSYKTDAPINFTAVVLMGKTDAFQWIVNEEPVPEEGPSVVLPFARAGEYNITVTISGEAGTSLPVSRSIQVARPLTLDSVDLTLPDLVVWPPGHLEVVVYLSGPEELPTLVQGDMEWGDDLPATKLDLHSLTLPQAAGVVVHNVSHHYNWHGTFHLALNLYNPVSRINLTREVRVVERLTLDYIMVEYLWQDDAPPWPSTMFKARVPLNLTAVVKTGKAASFNLFVDDKELTDNLPSIFHTFHSAGEYLANMTASGEAGVSPIQTASVVVIQPLSPHHLQLTLPDFIVVPPGNLTVQMVLSSKEAEELPSYVTYTVLWGDGSNTSLDNLMQDTQIGASGPVIRSLTHIYDESGDFILTWKAHNPVSEAEITQTVQVIDHLTVGNILVDYLEESDRPQWDSPTFRSGVPLNITAIVLSGDVTSYTFYIEGQTITSKTHYISHTFFVAGEIMINMTTEGEAGVSPPASVIITLEHPVQPHHLELTLNNLPVLPPGDADVTLTVAYMEHLPTNLLGVFSWGDGRETPLDLTNSTTPESKGPVVVSLMHNYTSAGEYTGHLSLLNSVSRANLSITLPVLDHLTLEELVVQYEGGREGEGGVFRAGSPLTLTTDMTTGHADQFTLTLNGEVFSSDTPSFTYTFPRAGLFLASVGAAGTAGISRPVTAWIEVLQPLREESATLEVPEKVLSPPGDANITITLSDSKELPTNVSGWVTWGDGEQAEEVGFLDITPPGAQGSVSHVLTHVYEEPGDYFVTWYIENKVSKLNLTKLVPVVQQLWLQGMQISVVGDDQTTKRPEGFFFVGDTIRLAPEKVYGEADSFTLSLIGQPDMVQESPSFIISFKRESDYKYALMGRGLGGTSNTLTGWVRVRNKQTPPHLQLSSPATRVGERFPLTIHTSSFLGACLSLDLGDGTLLGWKASAQCEGQEQTKVEWQAVPLSNSVKLKHTYTEPGTYNLVVRLFSAMEEVMTKAVVEVFGALPCSLLNVWVQKNGSVEAPVQMTRADKLWVRSFAEVNCSVLDLNMKIKWKVERVNDSVEEELPGIDFSKSVLFLPGRTLPYGLYRAIVAYNISMTNVKGRAVWAVLYGESVVEVGKSQLMVVIVKGGAPRIRRGTLNTLMLNPGTISYDPDYPERPLISYTWSCQLVGEELPDEGMISDPPKSREAYEGKTDQGGCWGEGPGWLTNAAPNFTLPVDLFRNPYKTYSLQVVANSSDGRQNSAKVEVEVVEGDPPTLVSGCSPAWFCRQIQGAQLVNPAKLILHSTCEVKPGEEKIGEDGCGHTPLLYSWQVSGVPPSGGEPVPLDISEVSAGLALQRIQINEAPIGGECHASIGEEEKPEGELVKRSQEVPLLAITALVQTVICNCTGWKDPEGFEVSKYAFFVLDDLGTKMILAFGSQSVGRVVLPYANLTLWAGVSDPMGAETLFHMANIKPLLPTRDAFDEYKARLNLMNNQGYRLKCPPLSSRNELTKALSVVDQTRVDMLLRAENSLMGISLPLHAYEDAAPGGEQDTGEEDEGEDVAADKNTKMLGSVDKFSTTSMDEVIQVNNILGSISYPLPDDKQGPAVDVLVALSGQADKEAPLSQQQDFVACTLATTVTLMKGVNKMAEKSNATKSKPPDAQVSSALRRVKRMAVNDSFYDEEIEEEVESYQPSPEDLEANEKVTKMLGVVGASQGALIQAAVVGEEPARIDAGENVNMAVELTSYETRQMTKWKGAVHGYGGGREQLSNNSATVQLSLVDADSNPIPVNNSLEDFIMYIPRSEEASVEPTLVEPQVSSRMALSLHNLHVPAPRVAVTVLVRPQNETEGEDWVLAWSSSMMNDSFEYADNLVYLNNLTYHSHTGFYELFLDSDIIGDITGTYTFGIGRYNRTLAVPQEHPCFEDPPPDTYLLSYHTNFSSPYYFSTFVSSCLFFDNERLTWSSDGCTVKAANTSITVCACNHLTSFGSGFFVTPNTIDFSYVFANAGFVDNLTIYLTLIITLGLYFIGLVYARIMDKKDMEKIGATPLTDNNPNDHYLYVLIVHTGQVPNSGTKSKVQFLMVGDWDETDVRTLNDEKRPLLKRGGTDHFVMATEKPLGPLQYLRIWHDNSGKGKEASWFFSYMVVRDVQNGEEFQFINNEWLAVEEGDGQDRGRHPEEYPAAQQVSRYSPKH